MLVIYKHRVKSLRIFILVAIYCLAKTYWLWFSLGLCICLSKKIVAFFSDCASMTGSCWIYVPSDGRTCFIWPVTDCFNCWSNTCCRDARLLPCRPRECISCSLSIFTRVRPTSDVVLIWSVYIILIPLHTGWLLRSSIQLFNFMMIWSRVSSNNYLIIPLINVTNAKIYNKLN